MAKASKISAKKPTSTRPDEPPRAKVDKTDFYCCCCGKHYKRQKGNFLASQSALYRGNGSYLPICNNCLDSLLEHYKTVLGDEIEAIKRICLKFDIYWSPEIYAMVYKGNTSHSRIKSYVSKSNLVKFVGKTYDDTLDEAPITGVVKNVELVCADGGGAENEAVVDENIIQYWGTGFTPEMYLELENRRNYWMSQYPEGTILNPGEEGILRQICNLEISINQDRASGRPIEKSVNALNTLFGSMNIKPSQKKELGENYIPFGVEIARFEDGDPIPEPDPDFEDVDGLKHNILVWFLGSLCKTAGIKNKYSQLFDDEVKKYTVERPLFDVADEFDDDNDNDDNVPDLASSEVGGSEVV